MKFHRIAPFIGLFGLLLPIFSQADKLNDQRQAFLQAEKYLAEKNDVGFASVSAGLTDYVLYPYLRYQWVKAHLAQTEQVQGFLTTYKNTRYAGALRSKWLDYLAAKERWPDFIKHYQEDTKSNDDCRWHWARYKTGKQSAALAAAKRLWLNGKKANGHCFPLFTALEGSGLIHSDLAWQRFEAAINNNHVAPAQAVLKFMSPKEHQFAEKWLKLHQKPELLPSEFNSLQRTTPDGHLFAHTIKRWVNNNNNLDQALAFWDAKQAGFPIDTAVKHSVERKFGMALLGKKDSRAYSRLERLSHPDEEARAATVRAALLEQNWRHVNTALSGLTTAEREDSKWQYWLARSLQENGNKRQAEGTYEALAKDRSFYGFLAADTLNKPYQMNDVPLKISDDNIKQLAEQQPFKAAWEFKQLGRDEEVRREWQFAIKDLPKEKLKVAAKLAQQWQWNQLAITTLVKANYWDDMALRFPILFQNEVQTSADLHQLEPAMLYGLMRQESMMDKNAISSAGAKGLLQLMPKTAMNIAKTLQEPWSGDAALLSPEVNVRYGGRYFRVLLNQFKQHPALSAAAYNAGPSRVKQWLPVVAPVPADIWIETIPFKETRKYVGNVLAYAMIYQQRLNKGNLKLKDILSVVVPG